MDFNKIFWRGWAYTKEDLFKLFCSSKKNVTLPIYLFFILIKINYEGSHYGIYDLYISYIHTLYYQYMKKYPWDLLYFMRFTGQSLEVIRGHDKLSFIG